jgi:hypothetical protein
MEHQIPTWEENYQTAALLLKQDFSEPIRVQLTDLLNLGFEITTLNREDIPERVRDIGKKTSCTHAVRLVGSDDWMPINPDKINLVWEAPSLHQDEETKTGVFTTTAVLTNMSTEFGARTSFQPTVEPIAKYYGKPYKWRWFTGQILVWADEIGPLAERSPSYYEYGAEYLGERSLQPNQVEGELSNWLVSLVNKHKLDLDLIHKTEHTSGKADYVSPLVKYSGSYEEWGCVFISCLTLTVHQACEELSKWLSQICHERSLDLDAILTQAKAMYRLTK